MMVTLSPAAYRVAASLFDAFPRSLVPGPPPRGEGSPWTAGRVLAAARLVASIESAPRPDAAVGELFTTGMFRCHPSGRVVVRPAREVEVAFPDGPVTLPWPARVAHVDAVLALQVEDVLTECSA